jgi:asparagine synthase (glutamine-hydrolysing)
LHLPSELEGLLSEEFLKSGLDELGSLDHDETFAGALPAPSRVAILESKNYMRNQLLRDADWASMAHSIELRTPLVDIEFLKALRGVTPRITATRGKIALGSAPSRPLPQSVIRRKKTGFGIPSGSWMNIGSSPKSPGISGTASRAWFQTVRDKFLDGRGG